MSGAFEWSAGSVFCLFFFGISSLRRLKMFTPKSEKRARNVCGMVRNDRGVKISAHCIRGRRMTAEINEVYIASAKFCAQFVLVRSEGWCLSVQRLKWNTEYGLNRLSSYVSHRVLSMKRLISPTTKKICSYCCITSRSPRAGPNSIL